MGKLTLAEIKNLRKQTGVGVKDCMEALEKSNGDMDKAVEFLRKKGVLKAQKRSGRDVSNGYIGAYVHQGQIGVLVEVLCETDFVARNEKFQKLVKELCLQVAASSPLYVSVDDVPEKVLEKEKSIILGKLEKEGKDKKILNKIAEGQLKKFYEEYCLLEQVYIRDEKKRIKDLINESVAAFGEKVEVRRFNRIVLGEEL